MGDTQQFTPSRSLNTAVLFLVFNRPDTTARVFDMIRQAKPSRLYVAADGPRPNREGEREKVAVVRELATVVDWPCDVQTLFREENLGCKRAVSGAISWFFDNEEQGIILEDDCLPHPEFFIFCDELLESYAHDDRVAAITGNNFQNGQKRGDGSYYFSKYFHCWGWATWARAWKAYQGDLPFWPEWRNSADWMKMNTDPVERRYWEKIFDRVRAGEIDSWAYPWTASVWYHERLTATPNVNLVGNIGFGIESTHTSSSNSRLAALPTSTIGALRHPQTVAQDVEADRYVFDHVFGGKKLRFPGSMLRLPRRAAGALYRRVKENLAG